MSKILTVDHVKTTANAVTTNDVVKFNLNVVISFGHVIVVITTEASAAGGSHVTRNRSSVFGVVTNSRYVQHIEYNIKFIISTREKKFENFVRIKPSQSHLISSALIRSYAVTIVDLNPVDHGG